MEQIVQGLVQTGVAGCVLAWLMWRFEARIKALEVSMDRHTRMIGLDLIARDETPRAVKRQAQALCREIEGNAPSVLPGRAAPEVG